MKLEQEKKLAIANVIQSLAENIPFINGMEKYIHKRSISEVLAVQYSEDKRNNVIKKYPTNETIYDITFPNIPGAIFAFSSKKLYLKNSPGNHTEIKLYDYIVLHNSGKFVIIEKKDFESIYKLKY